MHYMQWIPVSERLPVHEFEEYCEKFNDNPEFIVFIHGALVPTSLSFDGEGFYIADDGYVDGEHDYYVVTHWMRMPPLPEECRVVGDLGGFTVEYEALEVLFK